MSQIATEPFGEDLNGLCKQCGHPWDPHRLCGYGLPPTEGWIECPVEGCKCHGTWSLPEDVAAQIKAQANETGST